ncbi:MAG: hypothetical protein P1V51_22840 [Deltaproteobacteria bacterium]|nr:hypothetical protein [Deltaproteobacteria bacterium]
MTWGGAEALEREGWRAFWQIGAEVLAFHLLIFCPVGVYLYATEPAWSWNYLVDPEGPSGWLGWVGVSLYAVMGMVGTAVGGLLVRRGQRRILLGAVIATLAMQGLFFAVFFQEFWWVGSYKAFQAGPEAGGMQTFVEARLGWSLFLVGPIFVGVVGWLFLRWKRFSRRLRLGPSELEMAEKS